MKPRTKLASTTTPDGENMFLYEHDGNYTILVDGLELMHSKATASELLLGEIGIQKLTDIKAPRILIGGLGLGFTLKRVLEDLPEGAIVDVAELIPEVVNWNREHLRPLNGGLLDDPRVKVHIEDVTALIRASKEKAYDAILLDIDNGTVPFVANENASLYSDKGLKAVRRAIKPQGRAVFWSAHGDKPFEKRLRRARFDVLVVPAKVHAMAKKTAYLLYVGDAH